MGRIFFGGKIDSRYGIFSVTATGSVIPGFEPTNVQNPRLSKTWKAAPGAATRTLRIEGGWSPVVAAVIVIAHARRPIAGDVTVRLLDFFGAVLAATTIIPAAKGALDRRIFGLGDNGVAGVYAIEIDVPAGAEIARVVVDDRQTATEPYDTSAIGNDWTIEPAERVQRQSGVIAATFDSTARPTSTGYVTPVRKRRMTCNIPTTAYLPEVIRLFRLYDIEETTAIVRFVDSRVASAADIQDMHSTTVYGRCAPPRFTLLSLAPDGNAYNDLWKINFDIEERA